MIVTEKIAQGVVVETLQTAAVRVFATMLEQDLLCGETFAETKSPLLQGVSAQISLAGDCSITSLINCSAETACRVASIMLMSECTSVDAEVLDAMAEIANMIMGSVKTDLDAELGATSLSLPTVTFGSDFSVYNNSNGWLVVPFVLEGLPFTVKLCFGPPFVIKPQPIARV